VGGTIYRPYILALFKTLGLDVQKAAKLEMILHTHLAQNAYKTCFTRHVTKKISATAYHQDQLFSQKLTCPNTADLEMLTPTQVTTIIGQECLTQLTSMNFNLFWNNTIIYHCITKKKSHKIEKGHFMHPGTGQSLWQAH